MLKLVRSILLLLLGTSAALALERQSALEALAALPPDDAKRLVKIAACDGRPVPERWHFLVYEAQAENGYREYVVAQRKIVASREISQFATQVRPDDVIGADAIQVDSERAAWLTRLYAQANGFPVYSLNYVLQKDSLAGPPVWQITCLGDNDQILGWVVVGADTERIVSQVGFPKSPLIPPTNTGEPLVSTRPGGFQPPTPPAHQPARVEEDRDDRSGRIESRRAEPVEPEFPRERRIVIDPLRIIRGLLPF